MSSCQPIETAANRGRSPTIVSAAFSSSVASWPCVTTTTPTGGCHRRSCLGHVAVTHAQVDALRRGAGARRAPRPSPPTDDGRRCSRSRPSGTSCPRRCTAAAGTVSSARRSCAGTCAPPAIAARSGATRALPAAPPPERRHEVRIRQEPHVEDQVRVGRHAAPEAEAHERDRRAASVVCRPPSTRGSAAAARARSAPTCRRPDPPAGASAAAAAAPRRTPSATDWLARSGCGRRVSLNRRRSAASAASRNSSRTRRPYRRFSRR